MDGKNWKTVLEARFYEPPSSALGGFSPVEMGEGSTVAGILIRANLMVNRGMQNLSGAGDSAGDPLAENCSAADWRYFTFVRLQFYDEVAALGPSGAVVSGWHTIESSVRWVDSETTNDGGTIFGSTKSGRCVRGFKDVAIATFLPSNTNSLIAPTRVSKIRMQIALLDGRKSNFLSSEDGIVVTRAGQLSAIALRGVSSSGN